MPFFAVGGYYFYNQNKTTAKKEIVSSPTPSLISNKNNWKIYTNTKSNYLINHPESAKIEDHGEGEIQCYETYTIITASENATLFIYDWGIHTEEDVLSAYQND